MAAGVSESERASLRERPAGSVAVEEQDRKVEAGEEALQGKDRDVDGESAKTGENETTDDLEEQATEKEVLRRRPDEELDPRIQVSINIKQPTL